MVEIGKLNKLKIVKAVEFGLYLDGGEAGEILLPARYVPDKYELNQVLDVFIYKDSEDRIIATTGMPYAQVGEFALLKVVSVDRFGAFLDWGLMKDLLVPFNEQQVRMESGKRYIVRVLLDEKTHRIIASSRIEKFLDLTPAEFNEGDEVEILVANESEIGYKVIINNSYTGLIYYNEIFQDIERGQKTKAYIGKKREDNKIDLRLNKPGYEKIDRLADSILKKLKDNNGFLPLNDKSDSGEIYILFRESKKTFKKAVGALYKMKKISIENSGIRLIRE